MSEQSELAQVLAGFDQKKQPKHLDPEMETRAFKLSLSTFLVGKMTQFLAAECGREIESYGGCLNGCIEKESQEGELNVAKCVENKCTDPAILMSKCFENKQAKLGMIQQRVEKEIGEACQGADLFNPNDNNAITNLNSCQERVPEIIEKYIPFDRYPAKSKAVTYLSAMLASEVRDAREFPV